MDKPDFKERVIQLNTLVKQFTNMKRPSVAFAVLRRVLMKAQIGEAICVYQVFLMFDIAQHLLYQENSLKNSITHHLE